MTALKGFRTVLLGLAMAVAPAALTYLVGVNWTQYLSPNEALYVSGFLTILFRFITDTKIGTKE